MTMTLGNQLTSTGLLTAHEPVVGAITVYLNDTVTAYSALPFNILVDELIPFEREKAAFHWRLPELKKGHLGQYVAIHNGEVAAYGESENDVARRFFHEHPTADVYIGFVGEQQPAYQIRPASRR